jgi:hypothetical protein
MSFMALSSRLRVQSFERTLRMRAAFDPSSGEPSANVADADCGIVNLVENP